MKRLSSAALALTAVIGLSGCAAPTPPPPPASVQEADRKFIQLVSEEMDMTTILRRVGKTLWIYAPLRTPLFTVSAADEPAGKSTKATDGPTINYLDARFADGSFEIVYDIGNIKRYAVSYGYQNGYSEDFNIKQRGLIQAVSNTYLDLPPEEKPDFFVLVLADITNGVAAKIMVYRPDLERLMTMALGFPQEEFVKRYVNDIYGDKGLIGDADGESVAYEDIRLPDFLAKQMETRIKFKFQYSSFNPNGSFDEILDEIRQTVDNYQFEDYTAVRFENLASGDTREFSKDDLDRLSAGRPPEQPSQLQVFQFKNTGDTGFKTE